MERIAGNQVPRSITGWIAVSNAGWIRHHKHTLQVATSISCNIDHYNADRFGRDYFRSILFQVFAHYGLITPFCISTALFIYMQTFHMPSMLSAMFPVIGYNHNGCCSWSALYLLPFSSATNYFSSHVFFYLLLSDNGTYMKFGLSFLPDVNHEKISASDYFEMLLLCQNLLIPLVLKQ